MDKLDKHIQKRIEERLKRLAVEPFPSDSKFIGRDEGEPIFRYRIGMYRALYKVKHDKQIVLITKIDKRPQVYQD
ncbi:MAG: type II toxin-antitoxin system RelE/ParE family toxin [Candidatus Diapherotrites archaeon]|nr:type II toxin-antitoxin system RelE/ParE family toxin [Candidatus Diapherotrites archaeon]